METIDYFLQRYQEHLQRKHNAEGELQQMVGAYKSHLERANAKAIAKTEVAAGHVTMSGNDSQGLRNGSRHERDERGAMHHGQDNWQPVELNLGKKNGNGNGHHTALPDPLELIGSNGNGNGHLDAAPQDTRTYDQIRAANSANDPVVDDEASLSASCNLPGQDYPKKAYAQLEQFRGPGAVEHADPLVVPLKLVGLKLPKAKKKKS